jgi:sodium transport system permease protein
MRTILTVWSKELVDTFRDRRTVLTSLLMGPLLGPLLLAGMLSMMVSQQVDRAERALELPVAGGEHAPNLVAWLKREGVVVEEAPADVDGAIRSQDEDVVLVVSPDFAEDWRANRPALVEVVHDASRAQQTGVTIARVRGLMAQYSAEIGSMRLIARGIHPYVPSPIAVAERDLSTPEARSGMMLSFLPYILILGAFLGAMHVAMDSTAGERERQSLEPLLATPSARAAIMSGKLAAAASFALIALTLTLAAIVLTFPWMPTDKIGMKIDLGLFAALRMFAVLVPMALFGAALLTLISAYAKSYKEAQSYTSLLLLLPMIPTMVLLVNPVKTEHWMLAVPFLGQNQMIMKLVRGEAIGAIEWVIVIGAGLVLAGLVWAMAARLYSREQLAISA